MMQQNMPLRQRLPKKTLGEVSTNTNANSTTEVQHSEYRRISPEYWARTYRKEFPKFRVFFDNLEDKYAKPLERKIKLFNGKCEVFFGQQCTHVVTTKPFIDDQLPFRDVVNAAPTVATNQQDQENVPTKPAIASSSNDLKPAFPKKPNVAKDPAHQPFFDRAHGFGIEVWSLAKMNYVVSALMNKPATHGPPLPRGRHENLDKLLMEEKRYGVSTGHRNGQAPRPTYVTFNEHYIKVEDVAGIHCPILIKEFRTPTFEPDVPKNDRIYPWPKLYMKQDVHVRSPFTVPDPHQKSKKHNPAASIQSSKKHTPQPQQQQIPVQTHSTMAMPPPANPNNNNNTPTASIPPNTITYQQNDQGGDQLHNTTPAASFDPVGPASADVSLMTSKTPYTTNTTNIFPSTGQFTQGKSINTHTTNQATSNTADKNAIFRRPGAPLYENMDRMDRRMVSNQRTTDGGHNGMPTTGAMKVSGVDHHKSQLRKSAAPGVGGSTAPGGSRITSLRPTVAAKTAHDQAERRKKDLNRRLAKENSKYCENCVTYYQDLEKHLQDESHQAFVRDKNNFKELDMILETTRRIHRQS